MHHLINLYSIIATIQPVYIQYLNSMYKNKYYSAANNMQFKLITLYKGSIMKIYNRIKLPQQDCLLQV